MNAVLYARVSSDRQDVDLSINGQLAALRKYADEHGYKVLHEYIDVAESGRSDDRPSFQQMIAAAIIKSRKWDAILVWKYNRFARNASDSYFYRKLLSKHDIKLVSINEPYDDSPAGEFTKNVLAAADEFSSTNMASDVKRGLSKNAERGNHNGKPPYGYRRCWVEIDNHRRPRLELDPQSAHIVRKIFEYALNGYGAHEIAKRLNSEGLYGLKGKPWLKCDTQRMLCNETYTGVMVWNKKEKLKSGRMVKAKEEDIVRVENAHPAIVSSEEFQKVQELRYQRSLKKSHPRELTGEYLLSGMLFCGCGYKMRGHRTGGKGGRRYTYYECGAQANAVAFHQKSLEKRALEDAVLDQVSEHILSSDYMRQLVQMVNQEFEANPVVEEIASVESQLEDSKKRLAKLIAAIEAGVDLAIVKPRIEELKTQQALLERQHYHLIAYKAEVSEKLNEDQVALYIAELRMTIEAAPPHQQKSLLRSFIQNIRIQGSMVTIEHTIPTPNGAVSEFSVRKSSVN